MNNVLLLVDEIWRAVNGYEGFYEVSNLGRVASLNYYGVKGKRKIIPQKRFRTGYMYVYLFGKAKMVHKLVYEAFKGIIPKEKEIDHLYGDRTDNRLWMLDCKTHKQNCNNPVTVERNSKSHKGLKKNPEHVEKVANSHKKPVLQYTDCMKLVRQWGSATDAARELGISKCHISSCCNGKRKSAGGYIWKLKEAV